MSRKWLMALILIPVLAVAGLLGWELYRNADATAHGKQLADETNRRSRVGPKLDSTAYADALAHYGTEEHGHIADARKAILGKDQASLAKAVEQLQRIGDSAVATLIKQTGSSDTAKQISAIVILGAMGQKAKAAIPALKQCADDENAAVKKAANEALAKILSRALALYRRGL